VSNARRCFRAACRWSYLQLDGDARQVLRLTAIGKASKATKSWKLVGRNAHVVSALRVAPRGQDGRLEPGPHIGIVQINCINLKHCA